MLIQNLPDPHQFRPTSSDNLSNKIIYASSQTKYHYPSHFTPYLLVANFKNVGDYNLNGRPISINEKFFYFLNAGDSLEMRFDHNEYLETMLVQFSGQFIKEFVNYKHAGAAGLLDNVSHIKAHGLDVPNIPLEYSHAITSLLNAIRSNLHDDDRETLFFELLDAIWSLNNQRPGILDKIAAKRRSTKEEIYRRLLTAKLFMHDNFQQPLRIDEIAREASLDKFHFLKLFKNYYNVTPHRYLVRLKLDHARSLLSTGKYSVAEVCCRAGFESQGTFTNLFKRHYGLLPSQMSKQRSG